MASIEIERLDTYLNKLICPSRLRLNINSVPPLSATVNWLGLTLAATTSFTLHSGLSCCCKDQPLPTLLNVPSAASYSTKFTPC